MIEGMIYQVQRIFVRKKSVACQELDPQILALVEKLEAVKGDGKKKRRAQKKELQSLNKNLKEQGQKLKKAGWEAQNRRTWYDYAIILRSSNPRSGKVQRNPTGRMSKKLIFTDLQEGGNSEGRLVKRSQTVFSTSRYLYQLAMCSVNETRLLRATHILMMLHTQQELHKMGWNEVMEGLYKRLKKGPIRNSERQSDPMIRMLKLQSSTLELKELYETILKTQRKINAKLKMSQVIQMSNRFNGSKSNGSNGGYSPGNSEMELSESNASIKSSRLSFLPDEDVIARFHLQMSKRSLGDTSHGSTKTDVSFGDYSLDNSEMDASEVNDSMKSTGRVFLREEGNSVRLSPKPVKLVPEYKCAEEENDDPVQRLKKKASRLSLSQTTELEYHQRIRSAEERMTSWRESRGLEKMVQKRTSIASLRLEASQKRFESFVAFQARVRNLDSKPDPIDMNSTT
jgi:hypothetical protein